MKHKFYKFSGTRGNKMARKEKAVVVPREELVLLVGEINEVLGLDTPIKVTKKMSDEEIIEVIKAETEGKVYEIDFTPDENDDTIPVFSEEAEKTFADLKIEVLAGSPPDLEVAEEEPAPAPAKKGKKAEPEPVPAKGKKSAPAPAAKPAPAPAKAAAKPAPAKAPAKPAPAKKKAAVVERFTRNNALVAALLETVGKPKSKGDICKRSDDIYIEEGGSTGAFVAEVMFRYAVPALVELGHVTKKDGLFAYVK